jgi:hypothetical protein
MFPLNLLKYICSASLGFEKIAKGRHEWYKACVEIRIQPRKLNILMKT